MTEVAATTPTDAEDRPDAVRHRVPMSRQCPMHPPAEYAELRRERPISPVLMPDGQLAWLITRYEDAKRLLADPRASSDRTHPAFPYTVEVDRAQLRQRGGFLQALIGLDPPEHTPQRRMLIGEFTLRRIADLRPRVQEIVDARVDAMLAADRPVDLVETLSLPVPSLVICELLGVPYEDREFFQSRTVLLVKHDTPPMERGQIAEQLRAYFDGLVTAKENEPTEDLLGRLITRNRETGVFDHDELCAIATLLLIAGHETTANVISLGAMSLMNNPQLRAELAADPSLTPAAVEEMLRYYSVVDAGTGRVATEDIEIGGELIRAGEAFVVAGAAANWDEEVFPEPERLNIHRDAPSHVAFGFGPHQCLGQNLARLELEIVFDTLLRRLPGLKLAVPPEQVRYKDDANVYGIHELPVTW
jgi:cytochrome P450